MIALFQPNDYYPNIDAYLEALAEALRTEYEAIVGAGLLLQIDAPDLGMGRHTMYRHASVQEFLKRAAIHIEVLNHALRNVPADRVRMHVCWGNYEGPHHHDVPMEDLLPVVIKAKPQALLFEAANPRHAHEWAVFRDARIPDDKVLIPGVIGSTTQLRGAPAAGGGAHLPVRRHRRSRARDRRQRLRLQYFCGLWPGRAGYRVHEVRGDGRGRAHRQHAGCGADSLARRT